MNYGVDIPGGFIRYPSGAVYLDGAIIGHLVLPGKPGLDRAGDGCGPGWRIERNPAACRAYDLGGAP